MSGQRGKPLKSRCVRITLATISTLGIHVCDDAEL
jgi:hypothetical protein